MSSIDLDTTLRRLLSAPTKTRRAALDAAQTVLDGIRPMAVSQSAAARLLNVSRWTILRLVEDGVLHPVSLRGARRFPVYELEQLCGAKNEN